MAFERELKNRSNSNCELCQTNEGSISHLVSNSATSNLEQHIWICKACNKAIEDPTAVDENEIRFVNDSIWSELPAAKVVTWRMLHRLKGMSWAQDLLDMAYLDEDEMEWAKASGDHIEIAEEDKHKDCYGAELKRGDNVVLIKTLEVKGATFDAKVGTVVHNIKLVDGNPEQIEGRVNNSMIVILTKYVRKSS